MLLDLFGTPQKYLELKEDKNTIRKTVKGMLFSFGIVFVFASIGIYFKMLLYLNEFLKFENI
jgi:hypothetical protein